MWQIIRSEPSGAQELMDLDKHFLETLDQPTLHFYRFGNPSLTYGLLMEPKEHLNLEALNKRGIELGKRPTGGGALFHLWDLAFSIIIPLKMIPHISATLDRYLVLNSYTEKALRPFMSEELKKEFLDKTPEYALGERFCMAKPTQYDVMIEGRKCVGAAQRVTKKNLLHQATISICKPDFELLKDVLIDQEVAHQMEKTSFYLSKEDYRDKAQLEKWQTALEASLKQVFEENFDKIFDSSLA